MMSVLGAGSSALFITMTRTGLEVTEPEVVLNLESCDDMLPSLSDKYDDVLFLDFASMNSSDLIPWQYEQCDKCKAR